MEDMNLLQPQLLLVLTLGCSDVPNTAYFKRRKAILPSVDLSYLYP